ncbi:hypothetical protein TNCV_1962811 [Trichonephila clavipes]|nr:hypothetical protein TNCV_1962811 [Trichonephila clavipes]
MTRLLNYTTKEDFLQSFKDMYSRSQWSIVIRGDYFEGHVVILSYVCGIQSSSSKAQSSRAGAANQNQNLDFWKESRERQRFASRRSRRHIMETYLLE